MSATTVAPTQPQSEQAKVPQFMRALTRANDVRLAHADIKRRVSEGAVSVYDVLRFPPPLCESLTIGALLESQHRWGDTRTKKFLAQIPMSTKKKIGSCTPRQRQVLIDTLGPLQPTRRQLPATTGQPDSVTTGIPERSLKQRQEALDKANRFRVVRATLKKEIAAGRGQEPVTEAVKLIFDPPEELETMKLYELLLAIPKYGRVKVNRLMVHLRVSPSKTLAGLSDRQRQELIVWLQGQ